MSQNATNAKQFHEQANLIEQEAQRKTKIENQQFLQTETLQEQNSKFDLMQENIEHINKELQSSKTQSKNSIIIMLLTLIVSILALFVAIFK